MASRNGVSERVAKYRVSLRASGLRPVQIWVPDTRRAGFADECRRQCRVLSKDRAERGALNWLSQIADTEGWK